MTATSHRCGGWNSRAEVRRHEVLTVQLLPHLLREGRLPAAGVGACLTVTPILYANEVDEVRCRPQRLWDADPYGTVVACGTTATRHLDAGELGVLEVGERVVPVNGAGLGRPSALDPGRSVYVEGSMYLDADLPAAAGRTYRLVAVRRYRLRPGGAPPRTEHLDRVPGAAGIDDDVFLHVADLVAVDQP